jgi:hypothetical protein
VVIIDKNKETALIKSLKDIKKFFEKENITYWLDTGTLLGAVREKGFITWDYDLDIGIWHKDAEKIVNASDYFKSMGYEVCNFPIEMCIKIISKNSEVDLNLYKEKDKNATRIWHIPNNLGSKLDYLFWILTVENVELKRSKVSKKTTRKLKKIIEIMPNFKKKALVKIIIFMYEKIGSKTIFVKVPKKYFTNLSEIEFYDSKYKAPKETEKYLELRYGKDWRTPNKYYTYYKDDKSIVK